MRWLGDRERKALHSAAVDLYRIRDLSAFSGHVASAMPSIVPAEIGAYLTVNRRIPRVTWLTVPAGGSLGLDRVLERLVHELPVTSHRLRTSDLTALKLSDFLDRAQLHRHPVYNEVLRPIGVEYDMGVALSAGPAASIAIALYRRVRDFSETDRLLLDLLRPHLAEAHESARAFARASRGVSAARNARVAEYEAVAVDCHGEARGVSRRAHAWLTEHFGTRVPHGSLPESLRLWVRQQEEMLAGPAHDAPLPRRPLIVDGRAARLVVRLLSDVSESRLLLERLSSPIALVSLEEPFALTGREAEVMAWVAQGKSNAEVARIVQAQPRTIEKHLERIYKKLGVDNRFAAILAVMTVSRSLDSSGSAP